MKISIFNFLFLQDFYNSIKCRFSSYSWTLLVMKLFCSVKSYLICPDSVMQEFFKYFPHPINSHLLVIEAVYFLLLKYIFS